MKRIGFVVNPIAGMGGRVGLKGTDGVAEKAKQAGAEPVSGPRARMFVEAFLAASKRDPSLSIRWLTCAGSMGDDWLRAAGIDEAALEILWRPRTLTTSDDTKRAVEACIEHGAELLVFCGGDGTSRDVAEAAKDRIPILGIPAGVKMHSGIFAVSPTVAGDLLAEYLRGRIRIGLGEILDLDEQAYRKGEWRVRLFGTAKTLVEPNLVQAGKMMVAEVSEESIIAELSQHFAEMFEAEPDTLFLLGPGSTLAAIATSLGIKKTLLGIDAVVARTTIATDLNEKGILALLDRYPKAKIVVSPIGRQGFILGRGNLELSPVVLRRIGLKNLIVVATPAKLELTPVLRVDTGDPALDEELRKKEYLFVVIGYRTTKLHPVEG